MLLFIICSITPHLLHIRFLLQHQYLSLHVILLNLLCLLHHQYLSLSGSLLPIIWPAITELFLPLIACNNALLLVIYYPLQF